MSLVRIPPSILLPNLGISILITLMYCVDAKCDSCKNYFCPATSQILRGSGRSLLLDVSPTKQSDDHHQYLPNFYQPQPSEEAKPMTLPSCVITVFVLFATLSKIGVHVQVRKTASIFPLVLVSLLGSLIGGLILYKSHSMSWDTSLSPSAAEKCSLGFVYLSILFLLFLLPHGISLEQAALCKLTILLFSSLIYYQVFGSTVTILHCLLLTSIVLPCNTIPFLISKHVQTSNVFYCMISQESLLSNAVSLILYHLISGKSNFDENTGQAVAWHSSVICVLAVGIEGTVFTFLLSCLLFTLTKHCPPYVVCIVEAIALLLMSILAYFSVHFFQLPAILELTLCGICLRQYVDAILLSGSFLMTTANGGIKVTSLLKLLACICESGLLALVLVSIPGQVPTLFSSSHTWNSTSILFSLFIGINCTSLGLMCICWWSINHSQLDPLDHCIVYCSALRGLYAFSLALLLGETDLPQKHIMVTSLFAFIFFAVFVQSLTLKVLQNALKDRPTTKQELISPEKLKKNLLDHIFTGFKDVTGLFGYHVLREGFNNLSLWQFQPWKD